MKNPDNCDLIVFSHLRWDFVFQRPQHLLTRFAKRRRVFYIEEPTIKNGPVSIDVRVSQNGVYVVAPLLPKNLTSEQTEEAQRVLVESLLQQHEINDFALWYYTPMAIPFSHHLNARAVIYDCMDELSMFHGAHPQLLHYESKLFQMADVVFTGGHNLYEYKREKHGNIHSFPSSIEFDHFSKARTGKLNEPKDQEKISGIKIGYYGVIDERMNLNLLEGIARARPDWQMIFLGPIAKISPEALPRRANIHYLGQKSYQDLPAYISAWNVALLPFALNDSTRFISPTKIPEYLAAGLPVVSTSIVDVVRPYGEEGLVFIADSVNDYIRCIEAAIKLKEEDPHWLKSVDTLLSEMSWDKTWESMSNHLKCAISQSETQLLEAS